MIGEHILYDFITFKSMEPFLWPNLIGLEHTRESSVCTWEECVPCCFWIVTSMNVCYMWLVYCVVQAFCFLAGQLPSCSIIKSELLKTPTVIDELSIFPFLPVFASVFWGYIVRCIYVYIVRCILYLYLLERLTFFIIINCPFCLY